MKPTVVRRCMDSIGVGRYSSPTRRERLIPCPTMKLNVLVLVVIMRQINTVLSMLLLVLLAACGGGSGEGAINVPIIGQSSASPDDVVKQFLENWKAGNFDAMYAALSPQSQQFYSDAVFKTAYQDAATALNLADISY